MNVDKMVGFFVGLMTAAWVGFLITATWADIIAVTAATAVVFLFCLLGR
ncbi:MAG TPA: hypothetical protein VKK30_01345 [Actinomycetota bacterium]|nr:hypothetical protein [Actinomycetota bacterium]